MKRIVGLVVFLSMISASISSSAQDFKKAVETLHKIYHDAENLRIQMSIKAFESRGTDRPFYEEKAIISKQGSSYHHRLTTTDMIMNDKYIVAADHSTKQIVVNKRDVEGEKKFNRQANVNLDSLLTVYGDGKYEGTENGVSKYTVEQKTGVIQIIELLINDDSGRLRQINYIYKTGQFVTIAFDQFDLSPTFDVKEFDERQLVKKAGKTWQPAETLVGYRIVDTDGPGKG